MGDTDLEHARSVVPVGHGAALGEAVVGVGLAYPQLALLNLLLARRKLALHPRTDAALALDEELDR